MIMNRRSVTSRRARIVRKSLRRYTANAVLAPSVNREFPFVPNAAGYHAIHTLEVWSAPVA